MNELANGPVAQEQGMLGFIDAAEERQHQAPQMLAAQHRRGGFGGFAWGQIAAMLALIGALVWGAWLTRETFALKQRRIVAVNLSALVNDFIMAEARSGNPPDLVERETRHFMGQLNAALQERARAGETIVVGEAVVAASVPDITSEIRAGLGRAITGRAAAQSAPENPPTEWKAVPTGSPAEAGNAAIR